MSPVLGKKTVRELLRILESEDAPKPREPYLIDELRRSLKPKRSVKLARKRRAAKKKSRQQEWGLIRDQVLIRADGWCENCETRTPNGLDVDHFFGGSGRRLALQSDASCWGLCAACHDAKTKNVGGAARWLKAFIGHCERHAHRADGNDNTELRDQYREAAGMAQARLDSLSLQQQAGAR